MPKQTLTADDVNEIEKYLEMQKNASNDAAVKEKIDKLIRKLDEMEIRS